MQQKVYIQICGYLKSIIWSGHQQAFTICLSAPGHSQNQLFVSVWEKLVYRKGSCSQPFSLTISFYIIREWYAPNARSTVSLAIRASSFLNLLINKLDCGMFAAVLFEPGGHTISSSTSVYSESNKILTVCCFFLSILELRVEVAAEDSNSVFLSPRSLPFISLGLCWIWKC